MVIRRVMLNVLKVLLLAVCSFHSVFAFSGEYTVATYYFPGWRSNQVGAPAAFPWSRIKSYPEREPLLGWYDDGDMDIVSQQMSWMHSYGIDYVIFDWYWTGRNTPLLTQSIDAYKKVHSPKPGFAVMWSNHNETPISAENFDSMVRFWVDNYFHDPKYWKIDRKPVVYVFSVQDLVKKASKIGTTSGRLLERANAIARKSGYDGLYFVGGVGLERQIVREGVDDYGYDAFSAYNYHIGLELGSSKLKALSASYAELDRGYQFVWDWMVKFAKRPYFIPVTSGWNKAPWGGSSDSEHDKSESNVDSFRSHLNSARAYLDNYPAATNKTIVICCWNEYGEGSYIEPTKKMGFQYLDVVKQVFRK